MAEVDNVLAQYTIRSKQQYIFRTNRIVEIVGGSNNISKAWEWLFEEAQKAGVKVERVSDNAEGNFSYEKIRAAFEDGSIQMVELFQGGGNVTVLYSCFEIYRKVNKAFSLYMLKNHPGIIPMAVGVSVTGNYKNDYDCLMKKAELKKNVMVPGREYYVAPFSMLDRKTFQPYSVTEGSEKFSPESYDKKNVGKTIRDNGALNSDDTSEYMRRQTAAIKLLDRLVTKRGEESLLAVVHADGNSMGAKIMKLLDKKADYDSCVNLMRRFTKNTARAFAGAGLEAINARQKELMEAGKRQLKEKYKEDVYFYRVVIADGDDVTFICNARYVMEYVKAYLKGVSKYSDGKNPEWKYSSCAGICIFHSHYPFAKAYELAEQACDNAKTKVHGPKNDGKEESWVDFHYIHSGINGNLDEIRDIQGTDICQARPWRITGEGYCKNDYSRLEETVGILDEKKVARASIKNLGTVWEESHEEAYKELERIYGHVFALREELEKKFSDKEDLMKTVYDISEIYDLWFSGR